MDNNQTSPASPEVSPNTVVPPPMPESSKGESKMIFWLIGGLVLIILAVVGIYWFLGRQSNQSISEGETSTPPVSQKQENLEQELNSVEVNEMDADFQEVDKDLSSL